MLLNFFLLSKTKRPARWSKTRLLQGRQMSQLPDFVGLGLAAWVMSYSIAVLRLNERGVETSQAGESDPESQ